MPSQDCGDIIREECHYVDKGAVLLLGECLSFSSKQKGRHVHFREVLP